jgi:hypothetical protein
MMSWHSTRPSSVVLRESPEAVREFPSELGIARTTDLTVSRDAAIADPETGSSPDNLLTAMHSGSPAN